MTEKEAAALLPKRSDTGNKGDFGTLLSVCGSKRMTGAAFFAASAALRTGIGKLMLAAPESALNILQTSLHEPVFAALPEKDGFLSSEAGEEILRLSENKSALLIGCGLGNTEGVKSSVLTVLKNAKAPVVADADALNVIRFEKAPFKKGGGYIITPHPLEFSRLTGMTPEEINADRLNIAASYSREEGVITVLKGAYTVVTAPDGKAAVAPFATSALSKGGSGDVLAGLIAGFAASGMELFDAARLGVFVHGEAALLLEKKMPARSVLPSDLLNAVPDAVKYLEEL
ncbi:MAG: NAD(P)H-hydrate dehydratase [Clostridia bacterium]|nr:NAD(P)H-hydrate dehydratase [Clostridia bacterium]